jgi:hypothetical protein
VRATDHAGNTGAYVLGSPFSLRRYGDKTALASWSSGWGWGTNSTSFGGKVRASSKAGASVTVRFAGKGIGWISRTGPTRGKARVYIDGVLVKTVDTHGKTKAKQVVFAANHLANAPHTLRIVVLGTSGRPRVDVDGFIVLR